MQIVSRHANLLVMLLVVFCATGCADKRQDELLSELRGIRQELSKLREDVARGDGTQRRANAENGVPIKQIAFGSGIKMGKAEAAVAIVEFSDYQCPFCARFHGSVMEKLKTKYVDSGKVLYVFRDYPLASHAEAKSAAVAARCAGEQGAYWAAQRELFANQQRFGETYYLELAQKLNLKRHAFARCFAGNEQRQRVEQEFEYGQQVNVGGTPTFFVGQVSGDGIVNVKTLRGAQPYEAFVTVIDGYFK